ncbi:MAG TPA: FKBP-type peptidyl-prolyl cis-trans isomerase [Solirubrobacterales bacterium]|nr:FKBP-type peptidyl-prolyl cis-trans isomerase [Solirubrobacterales bacterium]
MKRILLIGIFSSTVIISACGGSNAPRESSNSRAPSDSLRPNWTPLEKAASAARRVLVPTGPPPKEMIVRDLKKGRGTLLKVGHSFTVNYVNLSYKTGKRLEDRWRGEPFTWVFGPGKVVKSWVTGLKGMKVGGRRELIVPSSLANGNGALVYVIELLKVG